MKPEDLHAWRREDEENRPEGPVIASCWARCLALFLDLVVFALLLSVLMTLLNLDFRTVTNAEGQSAPPVFQYLLSLLLAWLFFAGFDASLWRGTPGKKVMGLSVVRTQGGTDYAASRIGFLRSSLRFWSFFLLNILFGLSGLISLFRKDNCCLHDLIAGSLVVLRDPFSD